VPCSEGETPSGPPAKPALSEVEGMPALPRSVALPHERDARAHIGKGVE
jgi:hypothetical protein